MKDFELARLKEAQENLFRQKQETFKRYDRLRREVNMAREVMDKAWDACAAAKEEMHHIYYERQSALQTYPSAMRNYRRARGRNKSRIGNLKTRFRNERDPDRRNMIGLEITESVREIKSLQSAYENQAAKASPVHLANAKEEFERRRNDHQAASEEFRRLKAERDRAKTEFDALQAEYLQTKEAAKKRAEELEKQRAAEPLASSP